MEFVIIIVIQVIVLILAFVTIYKPIVADKKVRNNIVNFNSGYRDYCFLLNTDKCTALADLSVRNIYDTLEYIFDADSLVITFSHLGTSIKYQLTFYNIENKSYLKVTRVNLLHNTSNIPLMINAFFVKKINAVPVDYTYFEKSVN